MKQILKKNKREKNLKPKLTFLISYLLLLCTQTNSVTLYIRKKKNWEKHECWTQNFDCGNTNLIKVKENIKREWEDCVSYIHKQMSYPL